MKYSIFFLFFILCSDRPNTAKNNCYTIRNTNRKKTNKFDLNTIISHPNGQNRAIFYFNRTSVLSTTKRNKRKIGTNRNPKISVSCVRLLCECVFHLQSVKAFRLCCIFVERNSEFFFRREKNSPGPSHTKMLYN